MNGYQYIVRENDMGYLPDSEPEAFDTLASAKAYARSLKQEWRDEIYEYGTYAENHITVETPLKSITAIDLRDSSIIYASLDTTIDRVIVISCYPAETL
jgi:hypothetical protein